MSDFIFDILSNIVSKENIKSDESLKKHTTFKIGGAAKYFVAPCNDNEAAMLIKALNENNIKYYVMGNGSNILADDLGYDGVIVYIGENMADIKLEDDGTIVAGAGAMLIKVARFAYDNSLTGMEFAAGIPGSIGGAVAMNAGAYGGEMKDIIKEVTVCDKEGNIFVLCVDDMDMSYRHSVVFDKEYVVLGTKLVLSKGNKEDIKAVMDELASKRREKQPLEYPSAGSTFKRPTGYFAGKLIEDAGLRGYTVGGAMVSQKHCGFVINKGEATSADVKQLVADVKKKVYDEFNVTLELEVRLLES